MENCLRVKLCSIRMQCKFGTHTLILFISIHWFTWEASLGAQRVKCLPAMRETRVQSLGWEDPLENGKATHSNILSWRIPWTLVHGVAKSRTWLSDFHFHLEGWMISKSDSVSWLEKRGCISVKKGYILLCKFCSPLKGKYLLYKF